MSDEEPLLRAIVANPEDDLRRLVYADWLDERGRPQDVARAEFIRLQCEREQLSPGSGLTTQEMALLDWEHEWSWYLPEGLRAGRRYQRGFPYHVECSADSLIAAWHAGLMLVPVESLTLNISHVSIDWMTLDPPAVMFPLQALSIRCHSPVGSELLQQLIRFGPYPRLQSLGIHDPYLGDNVFDSIEPDPNFPALLQLDLRGCNIGDEGAERLAVSLWTTRLEQLVLAENAISHNRVEWLRTVYGDALVI